MHNTQDKKRIGVLQVIIGTVLISFSSVFVKLANTGPTVIGFYRMLFGGIILLFVLKILRGRLWQGKIHFLLALSCSVIFSLDLFLWHRSITHIGPGLATLLSSFQVFFLAGFSIFVLKQKILPRLIISIFLAVTGLYLIVGIDWHTLQLSNKIGILFGLITAVCYAAYVLILRRIASQESLLSVGNWATLTLITLVNTLIMGTVAFLSEESFNIPDTQSWLALLGYGLGSQVLAWVFISAGLSKVSILEVGLILILQPALAFVWDIVFFNRHTPPIEVVGIVLCIGGIYLGTARGGIARH